MPCSDPSLLNKPLAEVETHLTHLRHQTFKKLTERSLALQQHQLSASLGPAPNSVHLPYSHHAGEFSSQPAHGFSSASTSQQNHNTLPPSYPASGIYSYNNGNSSLPGSYSEIQPQAPAPQQQQQQRPIPQPAPVPYSRTEMAKNTFDPPAVHNDSTDHYEEEEEGAGLLNPFLGTAAAFLQQPFTAMGSLMRTSAPNPSLGTNEQGLQMQPLVAENDPLRGGSQYLHPGSGLHAGGGHIAGEGAVFSLLDVDEETGMTRARELRESLEGRGVSRMSQSRSQGIIRGAGVGPAAMQNGVQQY